MTALIKTCEECGRILDDDDQCWYCIHQSHMQAVEDRSERWESKVNELARQRDSLQERIRDLESNTYRLEDKASDLERRLQDAEYRASQSSSRW